MAQNFHKNDFCPASSIWPAGIFLDFSPFFGQKTLKIHISVRGVGGAKFFWAIDGGTYTFKMSHEPTNSVDPLPCPC